jgi:hypothetical protein
VPYAIEVEIPESSPMTAVFQQAAQRSLTVPVLKNVRSDREINERAVANLLLRAQEVRKLDGNAEGSTYEISTSSIYSVDDRVLRDVTAATDSAVSPVTEVRIRLGNMFIRRFREGSDLNRAYH